MDINETLKQICKEQKKSINNWNREINNRLSMNSMSVNKKGFEIPLFIIDKDWLEKYESLISDTESIDTNLYSNFETINNTQFSNLNLESNLIVFEKIFFLDEKTWNSMFINKENEKMIQAKQFKGNFYDKILIIELIKENNYKMYCLFFNLNNKKQKLMQGFLKINNLEKEKDILNIFKYNKLDFINECYFNLGEQLFKFSCFELFIFECNNNLKKIDKKTIFMNDMFKDINKNEQEQKMISYPNNNLEVGPKSVLKKEENFTKIMAKNKTNNSIFKSTNKLLNKENDIIKNENQNIPIKHIQTGLSQINDNNFIIPVIQCFNNVIRLRNQFIKKEMFLYLINNKNKKLSFAFVEVIRNIHFKKSNSFLPLIKIINEMNPTIKEPKDLILFILETVDEELNIQNNNIDFISTDLYEYQDLKAFNDFRNTKFKSKLSIIFYEFFGFIQMPFCSHCNKSSNEVQLIKMLTFPIKEIKNNKNNNISIYDCFDFDLNKKINSPFYCNACQKSYLNNQSKILYAPQTLIINLEWGNQFESEIKFKFEEYLYLEKYIEEKDSINTYELIGLISYFKLKDSEGHYMAYCKVNGKCDCHWYKYDGEIENECNFDDIKNIKCPTILFYSFIIN